MRLSESQIIDRLPGEVLARFYRTGETIGEVHPHFVVETESGLDIYKANHRGEIHVHERGHWLPVYQPSRYFD